MYYAKWKDDDEWFVGMKESYSWGSLRNAIGFDSKAEIERCFKDAGASHWWAKVQVVFFHPLNLEQRLKGY